MAGPCPGHRRPEMSESRTTPGASAAWATTTAVKAPETARKLTALESGPPLDVIVMQVTQEHMHFRLHRALHQVAPQANGSGSGIEYECVSTATDLDTRGISPHVGGSFSRGGVASPHSPEADAQRRLRLHLASITVTPSQSGDGGVLIMSSQRLR